MDSARKSRDEEDFRYSGELFVMSHGLSTAEADDLLKKWGRNEYLEPVTPTWLIIFRQVVFVNSLFCYCTTNVHL
jgi:hypothetical protein